jgi:hypothetical protein
MHVISSFASPRQMSNTNVPAEVEGVLQLIPQRRTANLLNWVQRMSGTMPTLSVSAHAGQKISRAIQSLQTSLGAGIPDTGGFAADQFTSAHGKLIGNFNPNLSYLLVHNSGAG